jgi:tetratricopeptide (TPR) repeat protein
MDKIFKQVSKARRYLWLQKALAILPGWLLLSFSIAFVALLIPKLWYVPYTFESWGRNGLLAATAAALVGTLAHAWTLRPSLRSSAIELDRRFQLRERISSAFDLTPDAQQTPIGTALLHDAIRQVERIDIRDQFPIRPNTATPWVLLPILSCIALFWVPDAGQAAENALLLASKERIQNVKAQTKPVLEQVKKLRNDLEEKGLQEAADEFKKLEKKLEDLQKSDKADVKKLLADFNEIKREMEQRKESLGSSDTLKKAMENLKKLDQGPADKMADSLQKGDFKQAEKELEKMLDQLKSGKLSEQQKEQLAKQLDQMEKALQKAAQEQREAVEQLKKELEKAEKSGDLEKTGQLRKKLEQAEKSLSKCEQCQSMSEQLAKASQAMKDGNMQEAQQAMEEMMDQLEQMSLDSEALAELQEMMDEMQNAKNSSNCKSCSGEGCAECNGQGKGKKDGESRFSKNSKGEGKGEGDRGEEEDATKDFDSQVREQMRKGETVFGGKVGGPNRKGISKEEAREAILNAAPEDPDAIESLVLPKAQREQQREYFERLRGN